MQRVAFVLFLVMLLGLSLPADAGEAAGADRDLEELFGVGARTRPAAPEPTWRPGRRTVVWIDDSTETRRLIEFDPATGDRRVVLDEAQLVAASSDGTVPAPGLESPIWRPDGGAIALSGSTGPVLVSLDRPRSTLLGSPAGPVQHLGFSPDGRRIAWVRDNDLWVFDLASNREIRLTDDGSDTVFNGVFDWVYTEELAGRDGRAYVWSPDSKTILWLRLDDTEVPVFHSVDAMGVHTELSEQRYPKPGDPAPRPSLHTATVGAGGAVTDRNSFAFRDPLPYVPRFGFTREGEVWFQVLDRDQSTLTLSVSDPTFEVRSARVIERDPHWVEPVDGIRFLADGGLLWLSRASGFMHLVRIAADGERTDLTPGDWDVTEIVGIDPDESFAWVEMARPNPRERRLYRIEIAGGETTELTTRQGTHTGALAPDGDRLLVQTSAASVPPRWRVVDGGGGNAVAVPVESPIPGIDFATHRFVGLEADDGVRLDAMLLFPPDFDPARRHPVVVYTYGGPHAQLVRDQWPRTGWLFGHLLAGRGFVVFALDNRGSAGRGRAFEGAVDRALGSSQLSDQLAGVRWLRQQPWVDPSRIGIWGWSYGGYMAAFALTHAPGTFAAGAAVAPVTDWRLYDSIYTERYMDTPETNPGGYAAGSVLDAVGSLADPLLVIHGTGDDNVHVQHTLQLADRAWKTGKRFELVLLPNLGHGIDVPGSRLHLFRTILDFFEEHLGAD